ncbi:hypothetical protein GPECTOR_24g173 [Gonium pectorale]|uniref:Cilia- and flagella-associated protein 157 n=1 Tax=Gonium pectorale TaxID=33097 RepID=A0A150GGE5_GONPE|nr:hypothetical protein GPECTOR_24g173 [Gonium pectorale]|eukprot:KXZ48884.1 hypothetical protein GPECTOR_24g173 [Gonium pectorale]
MPPKKKDDKKKDPGPDVKIEAEEERELVEKELVIGYLRSKLNRYQENGDRLAVDVVRLQDELETQKLNLRDINEFLTNELKARSLTTSALESKVSELNGLLEEVRRSHEAALARLRADKDRELERLEGAVREHERKARITQEFLERKDAMEAELQSLKETLARKSKEFEQRITDMDRQHIQDREKWKREMAHKIKETKLQMMKLTDNQLEMTTKRTIMENEQMSIELSYQSRQTEKLLNKNSKLTEENAELRRQLELSQQTEEELARRNNLYQKTIKTLLAKLQDQGYAAAESEAVVGHLDARLGDLAQHLHLAQLTAEEKAAEAEQLRERLEARAAESSSLSSSVEEAGRFLLDCLADVRDQVVTLELNAEQRERVLSWLLERLAGFAAARGVPGISLAPGGVGLVLGPVAGAGAGAAAAGGEQASAAPPASPPVGPGAAGNGRLSAILNGGGAAAGGETSSSGVTLPPIPSFNRRQYGGLHGHGPLSYSSPTPLSAGSMGAAVAGEWGAAGGGAAATAAGPVGAAGAVAAGLSGSSRLGLGRGGGGGSSHRDFEHSTASLGTAAHSQAALSGGASGVDAALGGGGGSAAVVGVLSSAPVFGPAAGVGLGLSASEVIPSASGGAYMAGVGLIGGGVGSLAGHGAPGHGDVEEALAKVLSEVRPWGKRSAEQPLTTTKHSGTFLRRGQGGAKAGGKGM